jgi:U4/U6 small nuclear ribonucleoprotein PRP3
VIVEGGPKTLRRYEHLMMRRIKWHEDEGDEDEQDDPDDPPCKLAWTGVVAEKAFSGKFRCIEADPRTLLREKKVEHYCDVIA